MIKNQLRSLVAGLSSFFVTKKGNNTIDGNLYPASNGDQDIGSATNRFNNIYANNLIGVPAAPDELVKINASDPVSGYLNDKIIVSTGILKSIVSNQLQLSADFNLFVPSTRIIESGNGLTGGGHLGADRTLAVGAGTLMAVDADTVGIAPGSNFQFIGTGSGTAATWRNVSELAGSGLGHQNGVLAVGAGTLITVGADTVGIAPGSNFQFIGTGSGTAATWRNVSDLAGSGLDSASGVLAVGAGTLITVGADTVGVTPGAAFQFVGTGSGTAAGWRNVSELAGNGLTAASGVLAVGVANTGAAGLSVEADAVRLTSSSNPGAAAAVLASSASGSLQLVALASNVAFTSGFAGAGYRVDYGVTETGKASAEFDNLTVRGRMRVYELLIQQIRATNGSVFVSSSSRAEVVTEDNNPDWELNGVVIELNGVEGAFDARIYNIRTRTTTGSGDRNLYHGFLAGDVLRAQRVDVNASGGEIVRQVNLEMTGFVDLWEYVAAYVSGSLPVAGDEMVRLGSTAESTRQGSVYLTADDSGAPFIDIVDEVRSHGDWNTAGKIKARLGRLSGITDSAFGGNLSGYGLYANNVYLRGEIVVTGGNAATTDALSSGLATKIGTGGAAADVNANTTTISGGKITAGTITASQIAAGTITATQIAAGTITASQIAAGTITASQIAAGTITASQIAAGTITATQIAAGTITADRIGVASLAAINANIGSATISDVLTIGTSGEIRQGTGTLGSNFTGLRVWRESNVGRIGGYNNNVVQWEGATDGKLKAGAGAVTLDANGVGTISGNAGFVPNAGFHVRNAAGDQRAGGMYGLESSGAYTVYLESNGETTTTKKNHELYISASTLSSGKTAEVVLQATQPSASNQLTISAVRTLSTGSIGISSDGGGIAGYTTFTGAENMAANSTGTGTIKMKGTTGRDSAGFVKIYIGTTAYWVPVFSAITG